MNSRCRDAMAEVYRPQFLARISLLLMPNVLYLTISTKYSKKIWLTTGLWPLHHFYLGTDPPMSLARRSSCSGGKGKETALAGLTI